MSPENKKSNKVPQYHFRFEWDAEPDEPVFLDNLLDFLRARGFDTAQLVFSGFNGKSLVEGESLPRYEGIFAMNEAGWRQAYKEGASNPGNYAERWEDKGVPCIGLYDRSQLADAYSHGGMGHDPNVTLGEDEGRKVFVGGEPLHGFGPDDEDKHFELAGTQDFIEERTEFTDVVKGENLADTTHDYPVVEGVVHKDYPDGSPTDALVGVVFLERIN